MVINIILEWMLVHKLGKNKSLSDNISDRLSANKNVMFAVFVGQRCARELHDRVGQFFAFVRLDPGLDGAALQYQDRQRKQAQA